MTIKRSILMLLVMLGSVTGAWAGSGTGTKADPYTGDWDILDLGPKLKNGDYISQNCTIRRVNSTDGTSVCFYDANFSPYEIVWYWASWRVGDCLKNPMDQYKGYVKYNYDWSDHALIAETVTYSASTLRIYGHFEGHYTPDHSYATDKRNVPDYYICPVCKYHSDERKVEALDEFEYESSNGIKYRMYSRSRTATVVGRSRGGDLVVPDYERYGGVDFSVTKVARFAFQGDDILTIKLGKNVRCLEDKAIYNCLWLNRVTIGEGLREYTSESIDICHHLGDIFLYCPVIGPMYRIRQNNQRATIYVLDWYLDGYKEAWTDECFTFMPIEANYDTVMPAVLPNERIKVKTKDGRLFILDAAEYKHMRLYKR